MKLSHTWETRLCVLMWFVCNLSIAPMMKWSYTNTRLCLPARTGDYEKNTARKLTATAASTSSAGGETAGGAIDSLSGRIQTDDEFGTGPRICRQYDFPIFITAVHMFWCSVMCFPFVKVSLTFTEQIRLILPLSMLFAVSVSMGNLSLAYVYPSFSQMVSTTTPLITMCLHMLVSGARYNSWAMISVPVLSGGFLLCYQHEQNYHILGLLCSLLAAVFRGAKSVLQASLLADGAKRLDTVSLLFYMAPYSLLALLGMSLMLEGTGPYTSFYRTRGDESSGRTEGQFAEGSFITVAALSFTGVTACLLNIFNFLVTYYTGPLVLQILGNVKTVFAIAASILVFGNEVKMEQWLGAAICISGVLLWQRKGKQINNMRADGLETSKKAS
ncbi:unnamed protein product [Amoebophrya sp. A120]|nr:unnamed protein product [Amoebophrya sp. A120]|eukprot:GSA120T00015169001.1